MGKIQTVCGKIDSANLGVTTMHEHTIFKPTVLAKILMKSTPDMFKGMKGFENGSDIGMEMERRKQENITGIPTASISSVISSMKMPGTNPKRKLSDMDYYIQELLQFKRIGGTSLVDCSPLPFKGIRDGFGEEHMLPGIVKCAVSCVKNGIICEEEMIADGTITPQEFHILTIDNPVNILTIDHT